MHHRRICGLGVVEALHRAAPQCLLTLRHPFEGVTEFRGRSEIETSGPACAAFKRILHELTLPVDGLTQGNPSDPQQQVQLDDLVAVHGHNPHTLSQVDVRVIVTDPFGAPWKMDAKRFAAIKETESRLWKMSLHHCDLSNGWLDRLLDQLYIPTLELTSCLYSHDDNDTLILQGVIPRLVMDPCPRTLKMLDAEIITIGALQFGRMAIVHLPPNLVTIMTMAFFGCRALEHVSFTECKHLTMIRSQAFEGCHALVSIKLPPSVRLIRQRAFADCIHLTEVDLSDCSLLRDDEFALDELAFVGCHPDLVVKLPGGLSWIP